MAFKHKFTYEEKVKIVSEYIDGTYGFREICKRYDINQGSLKDWKRLYETFGWSGLKTASKTTRYSKETKEAAVRDYLSHEFTFPEILKKYQIRSGTQLKKWIKKYNGCEVLKSSGTGGNNIMTTGRKTTFDERIEIVQYCIAHDHNYAETAEEYQVSYEIQMPLGAPGSIRISGQLAVNIPREQDWSIRIYTLQKRMSCSRWNMGNYRT